MEESYSIAELVSDLGGQLGLWIGASMLSIVEFISFLVSISCYGVNLTKTDVELKGRNKVDRSPSKASIYDASKENIDSIAAVPTVQV
uniref:Uncharacterized protein n=1 Tax=Plectus sambesii TaxID=2011161 RepID=A0A914W084_9BILA